MGVDITEKIEQLEGVISCEITFQQNGNHRDEESIDEIHIVANGQREPKRIVRDLETLILVEENQEISHKKISIARLKETASREQAQERIKIASIYKEHNQPVCVVELEIGSRRVQNKVSGSPVEPLTSLAGRAVINTIEKYVDFEGNIRLSSVYRVGLNDEILVLELELYRGAHTDREQLVGAVYVDESLPLAVGKAIFKALNRKILY